MEDKTFIHFFLPEEDLGNENDGENWCGKINSTNSLIKKTGENIVHSVNAHFKTQFEAIDSKIGQMDKKLQTNME